MNKTINYRAAIDNAGVMTKLSAIGTVLSAVFALLLLILGVVKSSFANSDAFAVVVIPYTVATLFGLAATLYGMFAKGAAIENEEKILLAKRHDNNMLAVDEDARFTQQRTFDNYVKYAPYVLSVAGAILIAVLALLFFQHWSERSAELREAVLHSAPANPMYMVFLAAVLGVISLFAGAFYNGQSHEDTFRWLRPFGAWMIAGAIASAAAVVSGLCFKSGMKDYDPVIARILLGIYLVLAVELLLSFVVEFYRPRTLEESRPVFESRILALFTEPGGVMRNFADMLDYQFGFKVSSTWMYSFVERAIFPLLLLWVLLLWGSTAIHEVNSNEVGLRSNLGKLTNTEKPLPPGIYFTLPWPFGTIDKYSCDQIYEVIIGHEEHDHEEEEEEYVDDGHGHAPPPKKEKKKDDLRVVLWTAEHGEGNNNFIVANDVSLSGDDKSSDVLGDFYFVGLSMPIQYHVLPEGVFNYVYGSVDAREVIKNIGHMVVTEYLASAPFYQVITSGRREAEEKLKQRIQKECDAQKLGVKIIAANLVGIHPPTQVGAEFQKVLGAMEEREKMVLAAKAYKEQVLPQAKADALAIREQAAARSYQTATVAKAVSERFLKQLQAYETMPKLFMLKNYLDFLEKDCKDVRKYVLSSSLQGDVYELNLEEKERLNLFDANLNE
ncbi:MAG: hypothetical protein E7052_01655 [Lentisphaerae bacterium]|nr:hypothetical protein [Lentisphaerota bacterium]